MLDPATEKDHLAKAERDLVEGAARVRQQADLVEHRRAGGQGVIAAERLLLVLEQALEAWAGHRDLILTTIARLEKEQETPGER